MDSNSDSPFTFVDLFAGIGGFHSALSSLGGRAVFASESNVAAAEVYERTYGLRPQGDIRSVTAAAVPPHDVLAAGFPCQVFSKAGFQVGFKDRARGTLFFDVLRIISHHLPRHILLENVRNIASHDSGVTWKIIRGSLGELGYTLDPVPLVASPHELSPLHGAPQLRPRVLMFATRGAPALPPPHSVGTDIKETWDLRGWLEGILSSERSLENAQLRDIELEAAKMWGLFAAAVPNPLPGHPIWEPYLKARISASELAGMPSWKQRFCRQNQAFYLENRRQIDAWRQHARPDRFPPSYRKFEWQAQGARREGSDDIFELLLQFRPSGLRVKRPTCAPALVAIGQTPILGWQRRRMTTEEGAALQGFGADLKLRHGTAEAYRQLGNAVHVGVVTEFFRQLVDQAESVTSAAAQAQLL